MVPLVPLSLSYALHVYRRIIQRRGSAFAANKGRGFVKSESHNSLFFYSAAFSPYRVFCRWQYLGCGRATLLYSTVWCDRGDALENTAWLLLKEADK